MRNSKHKDSQRHLGHNKNPKRIRGHEGLVEHLQPTLIKGPNANLQIQDSQRQLSHNNDPNRIRSYEGYIEHLHTTLIKKKNDKVHGQIFSTPPVPQQQSQSNPGS